MFILPISWPDPAFVNKLRELGVRPDEVLVIVRPPASEALYHRFENELFAKMLSCLLSSPQGESRAAGAHR